MLSILLFIMLEALSREIKSRWPEELPYANYLALVSESIEGVKRRVEACKGALESNGLRVNLKTTKMMICSENASLPKMASFLMSLAERV